MIKLRDLARSAAGISLVFGITAFIPPIKIGPGYFNFSDAVIMIIAIVYGGAVGAIAALGAGIADFHLGYASYIPFTIMTKCFTGYIIGKYKSILIESHANRVMLASIAMLYMVFTYIMHDWIIGGNGFVWAHILGNLIQGIVSIVIFDIFTRKFNKFLQ